MDKQWSFGIVLFSENNVCTGPSRNSFQSSFYAVEC